MKENERRDNYLNALAQVFLNTAANKELDNDMAVELAVSFVKAFRKATV